MGAASRRYAGVGGCPSAEPQPRGLWALGVRLAVEDQFELRQIQGYDRDGKAELELLLLHRASCEHDGPEVELDFTSGVRPEGDCAELDRGPLEIGEYEHPQKQ